MPVDESSSMAAAFAYEQPTIAKAWEALRAHLPTLLVIWGVSILLGIITFVIRLLIEWIASSSAGGSDAAILTLAGAGLVVQVPATILTNLISVLFVAVPAMHYDSGKTITPEEAFGILMKRPLRYVLAGLLFAVVSTIGFLFCIVPGIVICLVTPVYVNRIFLTDRSIGDAFTSSFQAVYGSPASLDFIGIQLLAGLLTVLVSVCTCGLGALVAVPLSTFYVQNAAYHKGLIS